MNATIFFGNGINRISDKPLDWNELLKRLAVYASVKVDLAEKPYTMIYEELLLRSKSMDESNIKKYIQQELQVTDISSLYERLYSIGVTNYITTNYDFSLESIFEEKLYRKDFRKQETLYSIRTHITMSNQDNDINIWHVHGDIERIPSIALGLDHYCGSVSKIDAYLKGNYSYIEDKKEKKIEWNYCKT
ncbi:MAG: SIR2 family protein [Alistipes shahii]